MCVFSISLGEREASGGGMGDVGREGGRRVGMGGGGRLHQSFGVSELVFDHNNED